MMHSTAITPRRILLATDLTSRGDRALDRALQLARDWHAELHIVHVVEASPPSVPFGVDADAYLQRYSEPKQEALRLMRRVIRPEELGVKVHVETGAAPAAAILAVAEREGCDLIVLGEVRERLVVPLGERTIEQIVRSASTSVLAVKDRPHGAYRRLLADRLHGRGAAGAGHRGKPVRARRHYSDARLLDAVSWLLAGTPDGRDWPARQLAKLRAHVEAAGLPAGRTASIHNIVEAGPPAAMLRHHVLEQGTDLTVIGAHARGVIFDAVVGNSRRIVDAIPGDILVVRAVRVSSPGAWIRSPSSREHARAPPSNVARILSVHSSTRNSRMLQPGRLARLGPAQPEHQPLSLDIRRAATTFRTCLEIAWRVHPRARRRS